MRANAMARRWMLRLRLTWFLDVLLAPVLFVGLLAGRILRRVGSHQTPIASAIYDRLGVLPVRDDYYEPLVRPTAHLRRDLSSVRPLPGIDLRVPEQLGLLSRLNYQDELRAIPLRDPGGIGAHYGNDAYSFGDAEVLYAMVRHLRPRRIFEIGSGQSTRFVRSAVERILELEPGRPLDHVCIEPYEMPWLERSGATVLRRKVEEVNLEYFDQLEAGDILFIDSSHVIRPQGDVVTEYLEILPALKPGVFVHVHDVFTPRDYPAHWVVERRRLWNEQYLLEALLTDSNRWEVVLALNQLAHEHPAALGAACPMFAAHGGSPGAFWIRRT